MVSASQLANKAYGFREVRMYQPVLLIASSGADHPLIDIDLTILIQLVIFLVMSLVATQWLFKPYLKMREDRTKGIEGGREDAERLSAEADARMADYERKLAAARERARGEQQRIRGEAASHHAELVERTRADAAKAMEAARATLAAETTAARADLLPRADTIARQMVAKLLEREVA
jgi:F-type H+-transporting ATPase subunit b